MSWLLGAALPSAEARALGFTRLESHLFIRLGQRVAVEGPKPNVFLRITTLTSTRVDTKHSAEVTSFGAISFDDYPRGLASQARLWRSEFVALKCSVARGSNIFRKAHGRTLHGLHLCKLNIWNTPPFGNNMAILIEIEHDMICI